MARTARKAPDDTGEIKTKDFAGAVRLWRSDIKAAASESATQMKAIGEAYKAIKKGCNIQPQAAKLALKLYGMEEAKRDDFIRCLTGLCKELGIPMQSNDLVDQAEAKDRYARPKPALIAVPQSDGTETDLADAAEFSEASEQELAQQEGRGSAPGEGEED